MRAILVLVLSAWGCTKDVNRCSTDSDCGDIAHPFCDVNGEYAYSGGIAGVCTAVPADCPAARCGCAPDASTCTGDKLSICNNDGRSSTDTLCGLGCATDAQRCATFTPSNDLGGALAMAKIADDVVLGSVNIDDAGTITKVGDGTVVPVLSISVPQLSAPSIRVYIAHSFIIHDATITSKAAGFGSSPVAFVAAGSITIDGLFDAGAATNHTGMFGAGSQPATATCAGTAGYDGGGGGGNATAGSAGSPTFSIPPLPGAGGGAAQADHFEPLIGGCPGGDDGMNGNLGGRGGAGIQLVSGTAINLPSTGIINVGGQGGGKNAGGGSGGTLVLQAPNISIVGLVAANGGSGGACSNYGNAGTLGVTPAASVGGCGSSHSGTGGTATLAPTPASGAAEGAGGGGAVGRVLIETADGTYGTGTVSAKVTAGQLERK